MSRPRLPVIAGLGRDVGTSTLAAALHAIDGGRWGGGPVDVLVCRAGDDLSAVPAVAVLVVRGGGPAPVHGGAVVVLPEVAAWTGEDVTRTAARLLGLPAARRPPDLRGYAEALVAVVAALLRSGVLDPASVPSTPPPLRGAPPGRRPTAGVPHLEPPRPAPPRYPPVPVRAAPPEPAPARPGPRVRRGVVIAAPPPARSAVGAAEPVPTAAARPDAPPAARPDAPPASRPDVPPAARLGAPAAAAVDGSRAAPVDTPPAPPDGPVDGAGPRAPSAADPGLPRLLRPATAPTVPVLLHRAEPVQPTLVAGRALRIAAGSPSDLPPRRRPRIAPTAPPITPGAANGGADDDTIDGDTIDGTGPAVPGPVLRTG